jgi:4-coumarate--CoA ligase
MYPVAMLGVLCAGGIWSPLLFSLNAFEVSRYFGIVEPKVIFTSEDLLVPIRKACELADIPSSKIYIVSSDPQNIIHADTGKSLIRSSVIPWPRITDLEVLKSTTVFLHFTSGTTGLPKYMTYFHH